MAFYEPLDEETFASTPATAGPWGPHAQHAGPPSALLARAIERAPGGEGRRLARLSVDILGSVPLEPLAVTVETLRPGRSVELLQATASVDGRPMLVARGWRHALAPASTPPTVPGSGTDGVAPPADLPPEAPETAGMPGMHVAGYVSSIDWRWTTGSFAELGPSTAWVRQRIPLVAGEEPSPWQRALTVADSGNGMSFDVDPLRWPAINSEITVHLFRDPVGEWLEVAARTHLEPGGGATATTDLADARGPIGRGAQALLVRDLRPDAG
ncbi:thioesterase family protein [Patulibacter brassicae]|uniref:Thioesterase family protein n=1 Tax=Patulibacter brassicae TaxID=1705717 RepID=A0ABU4VL66_9ACTN|nr:thioesterase family protein [Patulibacter brassicae]MDX8152572.1 thioesterase family protein [Patulibacter brassicae]